MVSVVGLVETITNCGLAVTLVLGAADEARVERGVRYGVGCSRVGGLSGHQRQQAGRCRGAHCGRRRRRGLRMGRLGWGRERRRRRWGRWRRKGTGREGGHRALPVLVQGLGRQGHGQRQVRSGQRRPVLVVGTVEAGLVLDGLMMLGLDSLRRRVLLIVVVAAVGSLTVIVWQGLAAQWRRRLVWVANLRRLTDAIERTRTAAIGQLLGTVGRLLIEMLMLLLLLRRPHIVADGG